MARSSKKKNDPLDLLEAHQYHTAEAMRALVGVVEAIVEAGEVDHEVLGKLVDRIHNVNQDYRNLALGLAPVEQFPDRANRWPNLFQGRKDNVQ